MLKSLFNWKVLLNILLAIVVFTLVLVWLTFSLVNFHTNHGKKLKCLMLSTCQHKRPSEVLDNAGGLSVRQP